jgi:hypothetical protein
MVSKVWILRLYFSSSYMVRVSPINYSTLKINSTTNSAVLIYNIFFFNGSLNTYLNVSCVQLKRGKRL